MANHRIALVEDNPDNRMLVVALLEDQYQVDEYPDGQAALAGVEKAKPDLFLLDISLPEMDGPEILRRLRDREEFAKIPAIALTAHAMAGDRERFLELGFNDHVTKPIVDEEVLFTAIRQLLPGDSA